MKNKVLFILLMISSLTQAQVDTNLVKKMPPFFSQIDAPFATKELVEIHRFNPDYLQNIFLPETDRKTVSSVNVYINDICANVFYDSLSIVVGSDVESTVNDMRILLPHFTPNKPSVNWGEVFDICPTCPFLTEPYDDHTFPVKFVLLYMGYDEILEMIHFENGESWKNMLLSMAGGDYFSSNICANDIIYRIKCNEIRFLINKWSKYKNEDIEEMVSVLKNLLKEERPHFESFNETWTIMVSGKKCYLTLEMEQMSQIKAVLMDPTDSKELVFDGKCEDFGCVINLKMIGRDSSGILDIQLRKSNRSIQGSWTDISTGGKKMLRSISR